MSDINEMNEGLKWYVAHTYSGYENKVKANLEKIVENRGLGDLITDIRIPTETEIRFFRQIVCAPVSSSSRMRIFSCSPLTAST